LRTHSLSDQQADVAISSTCYNGIEKFANYALEGKHSTIKWILAYSTSGFSYGPAEEARQELCALLQLEQHTPPVPSTASHFSAKS